MSILHLVFSYDLLFSGCFSWSVVLGRKESCYSLMGALGFRSAFLRLAEGSWDGPVGLAHVDMRGDEHTVQMTFGRAMMGPETTHHG